MKRAFSAGAVATFLLAQACGNASSEVASDELRQQRSRIVGGIPDLNHRYVVSLNGCSGTLISKQTVLTAGHCHGSVSSVTFGAKSTGGTTIRIASKVRDPLYKTICDQDATYDLSVVKLETPATVQPAPLLRATLDNTPKYIGPSWVWVGFGLTMQGGTSGTKRVTTFPVDLVGPATGRGSLCEIPDTLIYATAHGRNACNGDSGGPSFFVYRGVEYLAGVTSSGDNACVLDDTQQRSDQPHIERFIQEQIDLNEGTDPCRSNGVCDETCNANGQLGDPDCAANHCGADGICAEACVAPRDPDCASVDADNCGDNGVCDLTCATDPDCTRDCAAEGNCIPNCPTPDPDCAGQDAGTTDAGGADAGTGGSTDGGGRDGTVTDGSLPDAVVRDGTTPLPDAPSGDGGTSDVGATDAATADVITRDVARDITAPNDVGPDAGAGDATPGDSAIPDDRAAPDGVGGATGGAGGSGTGGDSTGTGSMGMTDESGCSCRSVAPRMGLGHRSSWIALFLAAGGLYRRARRSRRELSPVRLRRRRDGA
jgi:Trypsin